jgi:hypothetical protein
MMVSLSYKGYLGIFYMKIRITNEIDVQIRIKGMLVKRAALIWSGLSRHRSVHHFMASGYDREASRYAVDV